LMSIAPLSRPDLGNDALAERLHPCDREWITTTGGEAARPH
jgi:hypothetical protein